MLSLDMPPTWQPQADTRGKVCTEPSAVSWFVCDKPHWHLIGCWIQIMGGAFVSGEDSWKKPTKMLLSPSPMKWTNQRALWVNCILTQQHGVWPRAVPHLHNVVGHFNVEVQEVQLDVAPLAGVESPQTCSSTRYLATTVMAHRWKMSLKISGQCCSHSAPCP